MTIKFIWLLMKLLWCLFVSFIALKQAETSTSYFFSILHYVIFLGCCACTTNLIIKINRIYDK